MPSNPPDSSEISFKIIEAVKQHPVLYISEVKGNAVKIQEFRQKVWKRISDELGLDSTWVKLRWKNLRDTYSRTLKVKGKSSLGSKKKKWLFEDHLSFLKLSYESNGADLHVELTDDYIRDINTEVIPSQDLLDHLDEDDDYSEYLEILEEDDGPTSSQAQESVENGNDDTSQEINQRQKLEQSVVDAYAQEIQSKFRRIKPKQPKLEIEGSSISSPIIINASSILALPSKAAPQLDPEAENVGTMASCRSIPNTQGAKRNKRVEECPSTISSFDYEDSTEKFFISMAKTVKKLPPKAQADVKMDIRRIVSEAEQKHNSQNDSKNFQKYSEMPGVIPNLVLVPCRLLDSQNESL